MAGAGVAKLTAGGVEAREQQRHEHAGRISGCERRVRRSERVMRLAKQRLRVRSGRQGAQQRVGACHEQRRARALVGDIAEREHEQVADVKIVDQVAADFLRRLQDHIDRDGLVVRVIVEDVIVTSHCGCTLEKATDRTVCTTSSPTVSTSPAQLAAA